MADKYELKTSREGTDGKKHYTRVGTMFPFKNGEDGFALKLEALPIPNAKGEIWVNAYPPRERDDAGNYVLPARYTKQAEDQPF